MGSPLVLFDRISLWVGERPFLDEVELEVSEGERLVVVGTPGSGKSFLLRLVLGLPGMGRADGVRYSGAVRVRGLSLLDGDPGALQEWRKKVGFVWRGGVLIDNMDIRRNITLPLYYHFEGLLTSAQIERRCTLLMEWAGIAHLDQPGLRPVALDPEDRIRAALARALIGEPCLLLADDPVAGLGPQAASRIVSMLCRPPGFDDGVRLHEGRDVPFTCLVTTTDWKPYLEWGDRFASLEEGKVHVIGSPEAVGETPVDSGTPLEAPDGK